MACMEICAFDAIACTNFSKGFVFTTYTWQVETLAVRSRSREFAVQGCAGVKWSLAVEKRKPNCQTTIGLYCKDAPVLVPAVFRIALYDCENALLMNRSCYFTFCGGSNGCGFSVENWTAIERRVRLQNQPLTAYLMIDLPRDRGFLSRPCSNAVPERWTMMRRNHLETSRTEFRAIESGNQGPPFTDVTVLVAKNQVDEGNGCGNGKERAKDEIHCHRHVLCSHSPVFSRMLESDFRESAQGVIDVSEDIDRQTMTALLRYMYCGEVGHAYEKFEVELGDVVRLLNVAEKYEIAGLKSWCQSCMIVGYDTDEQRRSQLVVADMFDLKQLKAICVAQLSSDLERLDEQPYQAAHVDGSLMEEVGQHKQRKNDAMLIDLK